MIKLNRINRAFQAGDIETLALNDVSFEVKKGEFVAVMGPSGCGKSTLLNVLGLIDSPTSGEYYFDGDEVAKWSEADLVELRKQNIGFIFQNFNLIDDLTVYENIELPLLYLKLPKEEQRKRANAALAKIDLSHRANHRPDQLSGGQQQRVAIARAIVSQPKVLLADEPTGNLDTKNGDDVMAMLEFFAQNGMTIIMVTHSEAEGERAHRVIRMLDGKVQNNQATSATVSEGGEHAAV